MQEKCTEELLEEEFSEESADSGGRLSPRNLWSFTLGAIGRDAAGYMWSGFLNNFVIYTKSLTDRQFSVVNLVMVVARLLDGVSDAIMGNVLEVTRTRWGKFKPWIAVGMLFSSVVLIGSFSTTMEGWSYVVLFSLLYFAYDIGFTMNDIAYWGMVPSLASQKEDRDRLTSRTVLLSGVGAGLATMIVPAFTAGELTIGGSAITAYRIIALVFCALAIGTQTITLLGVKEKPLPPRSGAAVSKVSLGTIVRTVKNNDQLLWCSLIFLLSTVCNNLINAGLGSSYIYFEFGYNGLLFTVFSALGGVASGIVMLFFTPISKRRSRAQLIRLSTLAVVGGYVMMLLAGLLLPREWGMWKFGILMVTNLFAFAGQNICYLVLMICIANTVEYNEWLTGARAEGIIYSLRPFVTKMGWAVVQFLSLLVFLATGVRQYTNQIADLENAAARGLDTALKMEGIERVLAGVPSGQSNALLVCMTLLPSALAVLLYLLYRKHAVIDEARYDQILSDLKERRGELTE
ncbi:MAG: MFS transporter [Oscillospiraceae bacterium]|nr:MFS transporter [Oscillospiraceae bacterium]